MEFIGTGQRTGSYRLPAAPVPPVQQNACTNDQRVGAAKLSRTICPISQQHITLEYLVHSLLQMGHSGRCNSTWRQWCNMRH